MCSIALACFTRSKLNCDHYICYKASHFFQVSSLTAVFLSLIYYEKGIVIFWASSMAQLVKNSPANAGDTRDTSLIPGSERSPGEGNGNALQYSCLENSMDRGAWWAIVHGVAKSQTGLRNFHFHFFHFSYLNISHLNTNKRCKLYIEWIKTRSCCIVQGTIVSIRWQIILEKKNKNRYK